MDDGLRKRFARAVRDARKANGLSQAEVAERIGIAVEAYGRLERGAVLPRAETLVGLAYAFNVSTDELLGVEREMSQKPPSVARDSQGVVTDPEWRRLLSELEHLSPRTLKLVASAVRAIRDDAVSVSRKEKDSD